MMNQCIKMDGAAWIDAREACRRLGVKPATLYAYVSRGLVRSSEARGRQRRYHSGDVERARSRAAARRGAGAAAAEALRFGAPVLDTRIADVDPELGPVYRGRAAVALAEADTPFEAVIARLWDDAEASGEWPRAAALPWARLDAELHRPRAPLDALRWVAAGLEARSPSVLGLGAPAEREAARRWLASAIAACGLVTGPARARAAAGGDGLAGRLVRALGGRRAAVPAVNRALVVSAEHGLNASTFAARVVASTGAGLGSCLSAALAALSGPLHGGACARVEALLDDCAAARPAEVLRARLGRGESIPGFGQPAYPAGDPRGRALLAWARALGRTPELDRLLRLERAMAAVGRPGPSLDFGLVALCSALGLRRGSAGAIFAIGRSAGWVAHVLEQREAAQLLRPTARYLGPPAER
jgi:citrate synthase